MLKFTISFKVALNELYDLSDAKPILTEVTLRAAIWEGLIWPKFIQIKPISIMPNGCHKSKVG